MARGTFVGRQPIVDRDQHVVAYELLFRSSKTAAVADFDDVGKAAVRVIVNTFASLGLEAVLGHSLGFFNVNGEVFLSQVRAFEKCLLDNGAPPEPVDHYLGRGLI